MCTTEPLIMLLRKEEMKKQNREVWSAECQSNEEEVGCWAFMEMLGGEWLIVAPLNGPCFGQDALTNLQQHLLGKIIWKIQNKYIHVLGILFKIIVLRSYVVVFDKRLCDPMTNASNWPALSLRGSVLFLTCFMSTLSAWSKVVRLWRSFIASRSSASLRSSIRRSVASSRLQGGREPVRIRKRRGARLKAMIRANLLCSRSERFDRLFSFASTSRRKVQHLYGWIDKGNMVNVSFSEYDIKQTAVWETLSHRVLFLCVGQSAVTVAPSAGYSAARDAWAQPLAGYSATAGESTGKGRFWERGIVWRYSDSYTLKTTCVQLTLARSHLSMSWSLATWLSISFRCSYKIFFF